MNAQVYITDEYKRLESLLLNKYGAKGASLESYANSVQAILPDQVIRKIREVSDLRNSLQHHPKESDSTLLDSNSIANREFFNIQKKADYIIHACSYPNAVLALIDASFKELEKARNEITTLLGSPLGIPGDTLEKKLDNVANELSAETLWKLCQFRDYFERAANVDFAEALRYSQHIKSLYNEIMKDLKGKNTSTEKPLSQERYTIDEINDDIKLIDGIHQKLLLLLGTNIKTPTFNLRTVLMRVGKIVDSTFTQTLSIEAGENQSSSNSLILTTEPLSPKQKIEELRASLANSMGAQLHLKGKNLQEKIENGKSTISSSLLQKIIQFSQSSELAIQDEEIDDQKLGDIQKLCNEIFFHLSNVTIVTTPDSTNETLEKSSPTKQLSPEVEVKSTASSATQTAQMRIETPISNPPSLQSRSQPKPTPDTSPKKASSTDQATVKKMQQEIYQYLGSRLHCAGKTLRAKIDSLKQQKGASTSVISKLNQFETQTNEVLSHNLIKPDTFAKLNLLVQEIRTLLEPVIDAIRKQNASAPKK